MTTPLLEGITFGRDASASVVLAGNEASRTHAAVRFVGPIPSLVDLQSRNGTWVNGERITDRVVGPGDVARIGEWVGVVVELERPDEVLDCREIIPGWYGGAKLARAAAHAARVARTDLPIVVEGETGTGKEGFAKAVHAWSGRSGQLVAVNCAAIPQTMAEGELFGYRKGAFTGADRANAGYFRAADGGTLFLDEVLDLPIALQAKLLRVLEEHEVLPLGEARPVPVDVRPVCATQESLTKAAADGRFRADLLARLDGLTVRLPPLRSRREDIVTLFSILARARAGGPQSAAQPLDARFVETLLTYDWPLNVRELVLLVRRLVAVHGDEATFKRAMLPERMLAGGATRPTEGTSEVAARTSDGDALFERFVEALRRSRGNVSDAATRIGISRAKAYRLLDERPEFDHRALREGASE